MSTTFNLISYNIKNSQLTIDCISNLESGLKIKVYPLAFVDFRPDPREVSFYAELRNGWYVFETLGLTAKHVVLVSHALHWYADVKNWPFFQPTAHDPRMTMMVVK